MRSSATSVTVVLALLASGAALYGCSSDNGGGNTGNPFTNGGNTTAGTTPTAGVGTGGTVAGMGGSTAGGSSGGITGGGMSGGGGTPIGGMSGAAGSGGGAGGGTGTDITKVWKSDGCAKAFAGQSGQKVTMATMGTKAADCAAKTGGGTPKCGPWGQAGSSWQTDPLGRDYWVYMPANYDMNKAYPLVFEGPGCSGSGGGVYDLTAVKDQVIRIGISPVYKNAPYQTMFGTNNDPGHGTNPEQGCFDDKEGDDSLDWVFYENLYDTLNTAVCFDRNRVFSVGDSSGSWFSNEVGCKYAGDAKRPIRGVLPNTGGLPNQPQFEPTCTKAPMSGIWVHESGDTENAFAGNKFAINRAMTVNGCMGATDYDDAKAKNMLMNFPIGNNNPDDTCKIIKGCPPLYPLVVCELAGTAHAPHNQQVEGAFPTFLKQFTTGPFISQ